jgi:hypothetical protein
MSVAPMTGPDFQSGAKCQVVERRRKSLALARYFSSPVTIQQSAAASAMPEMTPQVSCTARHLSAMSEVRLDGVGSP